MVPFFYAMKSDKNILKQFTPFEIALYLCSIALIVGGFFLFHNTNLLYLTTSLVGATALIFLAKGNIWGQILTLVFSLLYSWISLTYHYFGELAISVVMTIPLAIVCIVSWARHPYEENEAQVEVCQKMSKKEYAFCGIAGLAVSVLSYFVLKAFATENPVLSAVSVLTSFLATYFSWKRSPLYAISYMQNDLVLIALWLLAALKDGEYFSMVVCFVVFLINDTYGYINWVKMKKNQNEKVDPN